MNELTTLEGHIELEPRVHYVQHVFNVPEGLKRLRVTLRYRKERVCQLFLSVFSPEGYRGTRMNPGGFGEIILTLDLSETWASEGGLPGEITPGEWRVQIDVERTEEAADYQIIVESSVEVADAVEASVPQPAEQNGRNGAGYYRGELHSHSHHSDGSASVAEVVAAARRYGLDFLSLTDHFTNAGWAELENLAGSDLAVLTSLELTGHSGHANLQGLSTWIDTFVDPCNATGRTINDVADETHAQGGLVCVNHPFSLNLGWRYYDFDWSKCDLLEVYHHLTGANNTPQLGLWDQLLNQGYRITGVGATDSHHPRRGQHRLGQVFTYVYADALSPEGIKAGLKRGRVYVSLGPTLEFTASRGGRKVYMGEKLTGDEPVNLHIKLDQLEHPSHLLIMKNGLHFHNLELPASLNEPLEVNVRDETPSPGYYRLELYARGTQPSFEAGRDWSQTMLLSNPIFVSISS